MLLYCCLRQDSGSQESNVEDVADSMEKIFEQAGELEVEEDLRVMKNQKWLYYQLERKDFQNGKKVIKILIEKVFYWYKTLK